MCKLFKGNALKSFKQKSNNEFTNLKNLLCSSVGSNYKNIHILNLQDAGGRLDNYRLNSKRDLHLFNILRRFIMQNQTWRRLKIHLQVISIAFLISLWKSCKIIPCHWIQVLKIPLEANYQKTFVWCSTDGPKAMYNRSPFSAETLQTAHIMKLLLLMHIFSNRMTLERIKILRFSLSHSWSTGESLVRKYAS